MPPLRAMKYGVWIAGALALFLLACFQGFGNGSAYIQFIDGAVLVYGAGAYVEQRSHIKRFIERHHELHKRVEELHARLTKERENNGTSSGT